MLAGTVEPVHAFPARWQKHIICKNRAGAARGWPTVHVYGDTVDRKLADVVNTVVLSVWC